MEKPEGDELEADIYPADCREYSCELRRLGGVRLLYDLRCGSQPRIMTDDNHTEAATTYWLKYVLDRLTTAKLGNDHNVRLVTYLRKVVWSTQINCKRVSVGVVGVDGLGLPSHRA